MSTGAAGKASKPADRGTETSTKPMPRENESAGTWRHVFGLRKSRIYEILAAPPAPTTHQHAKEGTDSNPPPLCLAMWTTPVGNPAESLGPGVDRPELARVEAPQGAITGPREQADDPEHSHFRRLSYPRQLPVCGGLSLAVVLE